MSDVNNLVPIIIPREYLSYDNWPGPYRLLKHPELALTWVVLEPGQWMNYLTQDQAGAWAEEGIDYERQALENLERITGGDAWTHSKVDSEGSLLYAAMMHEDGLGSSRVLLRERWSELFPRGYWVAIPERSFALVVPKEVSSEGLQEAKDLAVKCWEGGTTPMLPDLLEQEDVQMEAAV
ncbi:MAG: hypothetical protein ACJ741_14340 [Pyrinomonadaceae bacterium]